MNVFTPTPTTIQLRPSRLAGLMISAAALAAVITWALLVFAVGTSSDVAPQSNGTVNHLTPSSTALSPEERVYIDAVNRYLSEGIVLYGPIYGVSSAGSPDGG